jgi:hypothetical protein
MVFLKPVIGAQAGSFCTGHFAGPVGFCTGPNQFTQIPKATTSSTKTIHRGVSRPLFPLQQEQLQHEPRRPIPLEQEQLQHEPWPLFPLQQEQLQHEPRRLIPLEQEQLQHEPWPLSHSNRNSFSTNRGDSSHWNRNATNSHRCILLALGQIFALGRIFTL